MILIHTAFFAEAKVIIEHFKLQCLQTKPYKIYKKDNIILAICGMGAKNTLHVEGIFKDYNIKKAINIGIAGCKNSDIEIGTLACTTHRFKNIPFLDITSFDKPLNNTKNLDTMLVDMEAETFLHVSQKILHVEDIYIFKIISDHLDTKIPKKEFVWKIIDKNLKNILLALDLRN